MATREYVQPTIFSDSDGVFAFETIDGQIYFKIGALNDDDQLFIESIIAGGFIGFFQNDKEIGFAEITADYDSTNGIGVSSVPDLRLNDDYVIKFTQARRGRDAEPPPVPRIQYAPRLTAFLRRTFEVDMTLFGDDYDPDEVELFVSASVDTLILGLVDNANAINNLAKGTEIQLVQGTREVFIKVNRRQGLNSTFVIYEVSGLDSQELTSADNDFTEGEGVKIFVWTTDGSWHDEQQDDDHFYRIAVGENPVWSDPILIVKKETIYAMLTEILQAGTGISFDEDDTNNEFTINRA